MPRLPIASLAASTAVPINIDDHNDYVVIPDDRSITLDDYDYITVPDDELLEDEHTEEPPSNLCSYKVPLEGYQRELQSYQTDHLTLLAGGKMDVEIHGHGEAEFLRILYIREDIFSKEVNIIGHRFIRNSNIHLQGVLDTTYQDEVCWVVILTPNNVLGHLWKTPVDRVIRQRQIDLTNAPAPKGLNGSWLIRDDLVCRWKTIVHLPKSRRGKPTQSVLRKLQGAECDTGLAVPEEKLCCYSRGETLKGGSGKGISSIERERMKVEASSRQRRAGSSPTPTTPDTTGFRTFLSRPPPPWNAPIVVDSDDDINDMTMLEPLTTDFERMDLDAHSVVEVGARRPSNLSRSRQRYTFGDAFCGAGGVSRGAQLAGLSLKWGFDHGEDPCRSWNANFPYAKCYQRDVASFLKEENDVKVDILHLSPPCQPYSPANTHPNAHRDELNTAAAFAISELLEKCRPRLVTMENTAGLLQRKAEYFHRFIHLFTAKEYSVRWSILDMADYGVPQSRQRLIIIAAGPGETLPTFPPYSHAKNPSKHLAPWVSINSAIDSIPDDWPDHDVRQAMTRGNGPKAPLDGNSIAKCVTCKGGDNFKHPCGYRGYTNREFASLQTFPLYHEFRPLGTQKLTTIREQVGNAVPPRFAKVLFTWLRQWLEREDGVQKPDVMDLD